jgi:hypothetical protein
VPHCSTNLALLHSAVWGLRSVSQPWREAGKTELTTRAVEERLDAYVTAPMEAPA